MHICMNISRRVGRDRVMGVAISCQTSLLVMVTRSLTVPPVRCGIEHCMPRYPCNNNWVSNITNDQSILHIDI